MSDPRHTPVHVRVLASTEPLLKDVVALADANAKWLGMFPESCFEREAAANRIFVAVDNSGRLLGFLLFRVARNRAVIQQLCVAVEHRGRGVARLLTDELKIRTQSLDGIALHCAREFAQAIETWKRLGFVAVHEKPGRGKSQRPLTRLWFDHRNGDLWSDSRAQAATDRLVVVMDANIVFDLQDSDRPNRILSERLYDGWLQEYISLWVTDELFNEVDRHPDQKERERRKGFIRSLQKLDEDRDRAAAVFEQLRMTIPGREHRESTRSDLRQIATAIAGNAAVFVTHDADILLHCETIEMAFGLQVLRPAELIARLDEVARSTEFAPVRLAGTAIEIRRVCEDDLNRLSAKFLDYGRGERRHQFDVKIMSLVTATASSEVSLVEGPRDEFAAILGMEWTDPLILAISLARVKGSQIAPTLTRKLVVRGIRRAVAENRRIIRIDDEHGSPSLASACAELGFLRINNSWVKTCLPGVWGEAAVFDQIPPVNPALDNAIRSSLSLSNKEIGKEERIANVEKFIWPGKIDTSAMPAFIVPIQPRYAQCLFDEALASTQLLGIDPQRIFNCEHVYYRSSHAEVVKAPSRVLWYVSTDRQQQIQRLRGCSQVLEVAVDSASALFRRFRRLGVYEWKDVDQIAKKNAKGQLMAIRFGLTELFPRGASLPDIERALRADGQPMPPLSMPVRISSRSFLRLYNESRQEVPSRNDSQNPSSFHQARAR